MFKTSTLLKLSLAIGLTAIALYARNFYSSVEAAGLPDVIFLGEGKTPQTFPIGTGFRSIKKAHCDGFKYFYGGPPNVTIGECDEPLKHPERAWKTNGAANPITKKGEGSIVNYGQQQKGCKVEYLVIDDDVDGKLVKWTLDGNVVHTNDQGMVSKGSFVLNKNGELKLETDESIGVYEINVCEETQAPSDISVAVGCSGLDISGTADKATTVNWTFNGQSGSFNVNAGDFSRDVGTAITSGTHDLTGSASMVVDGETYQDSQTKNSQNCGTVAVNEITVQANCTRLRVFGVASANSTVNWTYEGQSGSFNVTKDVAFDQNVGTPITDIGPFTLNGSATMTVAGTPYSDSVTKNNHSCGVDTNNISVGVSCSGLSVSGKSNSSTTVNWGFNGQTGSFTANGTFIQNVGIPITTYGTYDLSGDASMTVSGNPYTDSDTNNNVTCGVPDEQVTLTGVFIATGQRQREGVGQSGFVFEKNVNVPAGTPPVLIEYDPKYLINFVDLLGEALVDWIEVQN